jgi:hypothetical protein
VVIFFPKIPEGAHPAERRVLKFVRFLKKNVRAFVVRPLKSTGSSREKNQFLS